MPALAAAKRGTPFDPTTFDYATATAPVITSTWPTAGRIQMLFQANGGGHTYYQSLSGVHVPDLGFDATNSLWTFIAASPGTFTASAPWNAIWEIPIDNCFLEVPILVVTEDTGSTQPRRVHIRHSKIAPTYNAQHQQAASTGAFSNGPLIAEYCEIIGSVDCSQAGSPRSVNTLESIFDHCWLHGPKFNNFTFSYYAGQPFGAGANVWLSPAQAAATFNNTGTSGMAVLGDGNTNIGANPCFFNVILADGGNYGFQCTTSGTLETWVSHPPWSGAASQTPFTSGTAQLIPLGNVAHSDGIQQPNRLTVQYSRIEALGNSGMLLQSANVTTTDGKPVPLSGLIFNRNYIQCDHIAAYVDNPLAHDPNWNVGPNFAYAGGWIRTNASATWAFNTDGRQRNRAVEFTRNVFGNLNTNGGQVAGNLATYASALVTGASAFDKMVCVRDRKTWKANVAAQFGWDSGDQRIEQMRLAQYDWSTVPPIVNSVMEARRALGLPDGCCDALAQKIWSGNTDSAGNPIDPTPWQGGVTGFDAQGYYTGG